MSNRNLVIVRAGDNSMHPLWLCTGGERNWDLLVSYEGDSPLRYPSAGEAMVRIDSKGPKWAVLNGLLRDTSDAWASYDYVWLPDDQLTSNCGDINRMFDLMAALDLRLAQPSFSWESPGRAPLTLHNPNFALRYVNFVDPAAAVFSQAMLRRAVPAMRECLHGSALRYVWPKFLENPARQCAILDRVQVGTIGRGERPESLHLPAGSVTEAQETEHLLRKHGVQMAQPIVYGAMDSNGRLSTLFDDRGDQFIYKLCEGYLGCAESGPQALGQIFTDHTRARREYLRSTGLAGSAASSPEAGAGAAAPNGAVRVTAAAPTPAPRPLQPARAGGGLVLKL